MKRAIVILSGVALFLGGIYSIYYFGHSSREYSSWVTLGTMGLLLAGGVTLIVWGMNDNFYNVKSGIVRGHDFTAAHMTPPTSIPGTAPTANSSGTPPISIPGHWVGDDWALLVEDERGRTGWLHFSADVFQRYPVGSHYPRSRSKR